MYAWFHRFVGGEEGASLVEFAITLPIMVFVIFASLTSANAIYVKQAVVVATYEACRAGAGSGGTEIDATFAGEQALRARGIENGTIEISPSTLATAPRGSEVSVTVSIPASTNLFLDPTSLFIDRTISATVTMARE